MVSFSPITPLIERKECVALMKLAIVSLASPTCSTWGFKDQPLTS